MLKSLSNASTSLSFKYNSDGIRTEKTVNGVTTKYTVFGDKVSFETTGSDKIHYSYDASGNLFSMNLNGTEYYYVRNAQGDITGLIDNAGNLVVSYTYDTWGKLLSTTGSLASTIGVKNPYRYRGYRYDTETGLYYLQSRYYNPDWDRFVNADDAGILEVDQDSLIENNLFVYALNNPVNFEDPSGYVAAGLVAGGTGVAIGPVIGAAVGAYLLTKAVTRAIANVKVHANSKQSKKPQHGYEIYNKITGDVVKVGISSGKVRADGKSYRAERQVRSFNRAEGQQIYESKIMGRFPDRKSALSWEIVHSQIRYAQKHSMKYHKYPGPIPVFFTRP